MTTLLRWAKFNLVGAIGMAVQLAALACLNRWLHGHYLLASAAALELTLLHNFIWHLRFTWRDRRDSSSTLRQLIRFHLSNGAVSLIGNLALMRVLVHTAHLPLLLANSIAILSCSLTNFTFSNRWSFAATHDNCRPPRCKLSPSGSGVSPSTAAARKWRNWQTHQT
jgi:putative flippase GtrA